MHRVIVIWFDFFFFVCLFVPSRVPLLVCCTKSDLPAAKSAVLCSSALEAELGLLCESARAAPGDSAAASGDAAGKRALVQEGETFTMDNAPLAVEFVECAFREKNGGRVVADFVKRCLA
jgi:signal recognition particle receptor subunit beta